MVQTSAPAPQPAQSGSAGSPLVITWAPWMRILGIIGLWVCGFFSVALVLGTLVPAVLAARKGDLQGALVFGGLALGSLLLLAALYVQAARGSREALIISDDAITIRGTFRTRVIPWERVARIEQHDGWYWRRAVRVVTVEGDAWISTVTSYQYVVMRGEPWPPPVNPDGTVPLEAPVRAAIAGHQRWLAAHSS